MTIQVFDDGDWAECDDPLEILGLMPAGTVFWLAGVKEKGAGNCYIKPVACVSLGYTSGRRTFDYAQISDTMRRAVFSGLEISADQTSVCELVMRFKVAQYDSRKPVPEADAIDWKGNLKEAA